MDFVKYKFPSEFKNYVRDEKLLYHYWNTEFGYGVWSFSQDQQLYGVDSTHCDLTNKLITMFKTFPCHYGNCLVQFWKAEDLTGVDDFGERCFVLTTRNQPFLLLGEGYKNPYVSKEICSYRMEMPDIVAGDGGAGGVIGRVYWNNRIEVTPNIGYYSLEEYPHREFALSCGINCSFAIPISDSSGHLVGVLEAVFQSDLGMNILEYFILELRRSSSLRYLDHCKDLCGQCDLEAKSLHIAVSEIMEVMKVIGKSCGILCAQTWILCNHCGSVSISERLHHELNASYKSHTNQAKNFLDDVYVCNLHLKKGEGVVGKAATSSHTLVYCQDVSQFSITKYPLAHFARDSKLTSCFAIGLKSDLTQSQIYVLEFFLNPRKVNMRDMKATLVPILEAMKMNFQTFKVSSGEEIGDNLFVQVIDARSPDRTGDPIIGVETSSQDTSMEEASVFSASSDFSAATVESKCWLTIKVNYGGDSFTFQLSSSSEILELSQQISRRMNLEGGTYDVKYLDDDNDWILLTCDEDLRLYILSSLQQEKYTLMTKIEPKLVS